MDDDRIAFRLRDEMNGIVGIGTRDQIDRFLRRYVPDGTYTMTGPGVDVTYRRHNGVVYPVRGVLDGRKLPSLDDCLEVVGDVRNELLCRIRAAEDDLNDMTRLMEEFRVAGRREEFEEIDDHYGQTYPDYTALLRRLGALNELPDVFAPNDLPDGAVLSTDEDEYERVKDSSAYQLYTRVHSGEGHAYVKFEHCENKAGVYALVPRPR
jgi:hypothetical protein